MNRDEKRDRAIASAPTIVEIGLARAVFPHDPKGGTWIAANDAGVCLALINWHNIEQAVAGVADPGPRSTTAATTWATRGEITKTLASAKSSAQLTHGLMKLTLPTYRPFRLIAIVPTEKAVTEWRWNLELLAKCKHPWAAQQWFSSGFDERKAEFVRRSICQKRLTNRIDQLRALHRSHAPRRGPFSICMHRDDAVTVSYTEVTVDDRTITMRYKPGSPCSDSPIVEESL